MVGRSAVFKPAGGHRGIYLRGKNGWLRKNRGEQVKAGENVTALGEGAMWPADLEALPLSPGCMGPRGPAT